MGMFTKGKRRVSLEIWVAPDPDLPDRVRCEGIVRGISEPSAVERAIQSFGCIVRDTPESIASGKAAVEAMLRARCVRAGWQVDDVEVV